MGNKMNKVLPGLYIGSSRDAHDVDGLLENKISHILSVHENAKPDLRDKEYMCLPIADSPTQNIACYFAQCNVFIHKARRTGNVLVHCQMGVSRSAAIVVAYLMTVTRLSWKDALTALKAVRPFVSPNLGFQKQLMVYEQTYVEAERTRLKDLFPLSQFNDAVHCEQLLEAYRLSRLRTEQPMDVDIYPLSLNAYGPKDFTSLRLESAPADVILCGPVSGPSSEEDCLSQRLARVHLTETFASLDTFSCGCRPSSVIVRKTDAKNTDVLSEGLLNDGQETRSTEVGKNCFGGNVLRPSLLSCGVREYRSNETKSTNDAALESLFSNSVNILKTSAVNAPLGGVTQEPRSQDTSSAVREKVNGTAAVPSGSPNNATPGSRSNERNSSNDETLELLFSNSVGISKSPADKNSVAKTKVEESASSQDSEPSNSAAVDSIFSNCFGFSKDSAGKRRSSEVMDASTKPQLSSQLTEKDLREIGRAYLREHIHIWRDMSATGEDDEEKSLTVKTANNSPSQTKITATTNNNPFQTKITATTNNNPFQTKITATTNNNPFQTKITATTNNSPSPTKIMANDATQLKTASNDPTRNTIIGNNSSETKIMSNNNSTQMRFSNSSKEAEITLLPSKSELDEFFRG